ncbi:MAG: hypothetical protein R2749_26155 [Acidimicrobiales bacterium]
MAGTIPERQRRQHDHMVTPRARRNGPESVLVGILVALLVLVSAAAPAAGRQDQGGPQLRIAAVSLPPAELIGDQADATIELTNVGSGAAADVVLSLDLPAGVRVTGSYLGGSACGAADVGRLVCTLGGPLPAGGSTTAVVAFRNVSLPAGTAVAVPVAVGADPTDPTAVHDRAVIRFVFGADPVALPVADVGLTALTAVPTTASAAVVRVDAVLANDGPQAASGITVTYRIPTGVVAVSGHVAQQPCAPFAGGELSCVHPGLVEAGAALSSGVMLTNVGVPAGTTVEVSIRAGGTAFVDPDPNDDERRLAVRFDGGPVPTVAGVDTAELILTAGPPLLGPEPARASLRWTLFNAGPATSTGVVVTVAADPPGALLDASIPGWSPPCPLDPIDRRIRCTLVDALVPGFERTVVATVDLQAAPAGRTVTVDATVSADRAESPTPPTTEASWRSPLPVRARPPLPEPAGRATAQWTAVAAPLLEFGVAPSWAGGRRGWAGTRRLPARLVGVARSPAKPIRIRDRCGSRPPRGGRRRRHTAPTGAG